MGLHLGRGIAWEGFLLYSLSPHPPSYLAVKLLEGVAKLKLNVCYIKSGGKKNLRKKKIIIYIYKKLNHFAVHLKLTQNCKSTIIKKKKRVAEKLFEDRQTQLQRPGEIETLVGS